MKTSPFLTDLDSRASIKGSRDPLGIQQIWTRFGRHVVGNLTTVSNSVCDFKTLILGYYFVEQIAQDMGSGSELATFLKWEQLAAYLRAVANKDLSFRGTERVQKNLTDGSFVTISEDRTHQILSNQKTYGLWGLYTVPARASGLVDTSYPRLTPDASDIVETLYLPVMADGTGKYTHRIRQILIDKSTRLDVYGKDKLLIGSIGRVLGSQWLKNEKEFFRFHLLYGGPQDLTGKKQRQLAELLESTINQKDFKWSPSIIAKLGKTADQRGWHSLANCLYRICTSETVLAPVSALFTHLLGLNGKTIMSTIKRIQEEWGKGLRTVNVNNFRELRDEINGDDTSYENSRGDKWVNIADTLARGDYKTLIDLLIEQNKHVMSKRGGAPWIEERKGEFHVRFREEQGALPKRNEIVSMWRFPYFLDSLRSVAAALTES